MVTGRCGRPGETAPWPVEEVKDEGLEHVQTHVHDTMDEIVLDSHNKQTSVTLSTVQVINSLQLARAKRCAIDCMCKVIDFCINLKPIYDILSVIYCNRSFISIQVSRCLEGSQNPSHPPLSPQWGTSWNYFFKLSTQNCEIFRYFQSFCHSCTLGLQTTYGNVRLIIMTNGWCM